MVVVSYSGKEINAKLVYYGPGLSGKTTNLEFIYDSVPSTHRGKMVSMKTRTERTLFFDFLPIDLGEMGGFKTRFLLYTVPGQVYYNATRKLVLRGVDAVVFVADSGRGKMNENIESLENLRENLREYGMDLEQMPWVIQYNKRDIPDAYTIDELDKALNPGGVPTFEAVATDGTGVFETFKGISRILLDKLSREIKTTPARAAADTAKKDVAAKAAPTPAAATANTAATQPLQMKKAEPVTPPKAEPLKVKEAHSPAPEPVSSSAPPTVSSSYGADPEPKATLGQKIARLFKKDKAEPAPAPMPALSPAASNGGSRMATPPAPPAPVEPEVKAPEVKVPEVKVPEVKVPEVNAPEVKASEAVKTPPVPETPVEAPLSLKPMAAPAVPKPPAVTTGTTKLTRVDLPGDSPTHGNAVIEKRVKVPVPVHLTAEEAKNGVTLKLVLEIELTTAHGEGVDRKTGAA